MPKPTVRDPLQAARDALEDLRAEHLTAEQAFLQAKMLWETALPTTNNGTHRRGIRQTSSTFIALRDEYLRCEKALTLLEDVLIPDAENRIKQIETFRLRERQDAELLATHPQTREQWALEHTTDVLTELERIDKRFGDKDFDPNSREAQYLKIRRQQLLFQRDQAKSKVS